MISSSRYLLMLMLITKLSGLLTEGEIECLGGQVPKHIHAVAPPEPDDAFVRICTREAVHDSFIRMSKSALLDLE